MLCSTPPPLTANKKVTYSKLSEFLLPGLLPARLCLGTFGNCLPNEICFFGRLRDGPVLTERPSIAVAVVLPTAARPGEDSNLYQALQPPNTAREERIDVR